jgi:signal transduction histidine kinase
VTLTDALRAAPLTSALTDEQMAELVAAGHEVTFSEGDLLFTEGLPADHLWILLDGQVELTRQIGGQRIVMATMGTPGQWAGGLSAWGNSDGATGYRATAMALGPSWCFTLPAAELARLVEAWSPFSKHIINGVFQTVRSIDATANQRESLVALGTLAAGLAHEINNPAAAILRSVESLRASSEYMLASLVELAEDGASVEAFIGLDRLRVEVQGRPPVDEGSIANADREEALGTWLEGRSIDPAWSMAAVFASAGVDTDWFEQVEAVTGRTGLGPALRWLSSTIGGAVLMSEIIDATNRIGHLVQDVKSYSQMDRSALQVVDVHEGIHSTLAMLRPKLQDIDVVLELQAELPPLEVYASELNQLWTNLIDNAVDAMEGHGTLRVTTRQDGDGVVVEVIDSGPGMDPDVQARVFEPFFTTKDVGRGTGLGLDISRRIVVDRHGGDISFDSVPGSTTVRVRLPLTR